MYTEYKITLIVIGFWAQRRIVYTIKVKWLLDSIDQKEGARKYARIKRSVYSMATRKLGFKRDNDILLR